jgi:hypothetical protein
MRTPPDDWDEHERDLPEELARELSNLRGSATTLPIDVLRAAGAGVLPDDLERTAQQHLAQDPRARALVDELDASAELDPHSEARLYARISREMPQKGASPRVWNRSWQIAAALGAIAVAGVLWATFTRDRSEAPSIAVTQPQQTPEAPVASRPETFQLPLEKPEIRISLRSLTWRGAEQNNPVLAALKPALDAFRAGDYSRADAEFTVVGRTHANLIEVALYQGVSRLFLNDVAGAKASLQSAEKIGDAAFANDVAWYLAIADERSGDRAAARARLVQLCPNAAGDSRACAALEIK